MELVKFDLEMDELIARGATLRELRNWALNQGPKPLAEAGINRVLDGTTSLDEVSRVIDLTHRIKYMEIYSYKAIDHQGRIQRGRINALNGADLELRLQRMGLELITYKDLKTQRSLNLLGKQQHQTRGPHRLLFPL